MIRNGDGSNDLNTADIAKDFVIDSDLIGRNGMAYNDLTIEQGTGSYSNHTIIKKTGSGEILIILENVTASSLSSEDFVVI